MHLDAQDPVEAATTSATVDPTDAESPRRARRGWRAVAVIGGLLAYATAAQLSTDQIVVKPGDTLTKIAGDYRTTVSAIAAANDIDDPNLIVAGRTLLIPSSNGETTHVVRMGDTVTRLAQIYGTTADAIVQRNKLADANLIRVGQTLVIPRAATTAPAAPVTTAAPPKVAPPTTVAPVAAPPAPAAPAPTTTAAPAAAINATTTTTAVPATTAPAVTQAPTTTPPGTIPRIGAGGGVVSTMWVVQPGDTVASIAARFGLTPRRLASANAIAETDPLLPGQRIYVPQS